jgi:esterase/lipase superfamily enzyme
MAGGASTFDGKIEQIVIFGCVDSTPGGQGHEKSSRVSVRAAPRERVMTTVFFITNRNVTGDKGRQDFGSGFHRDGPGALRFGWAEVEASEVVDIEIASERLTGDTPVLGSDAVFGLLRHKMEKHARDTVVFVHGYANTFRNALAHAALLKERYSDVPFNMVLFSWPSDGQMIPYMSYYRDRDDARASGPAMGRAFLKLREFLQGLSPEEYCDQRLHLMAHSMGNYAFRHGLYAIRAQLGNELPRLFDQVLLFAADEDDDAFEHDHKFRFLPRICRQVSVYHRSDDRALLISDKTKRNPDRLGSDGPRLNDDLPRKVAVIDCREVRSTGEDKNRHDAHRYSQDVIRDVVQVLQGVPPHEVEGREFIQATRSFKIRRG